MVERGPDGSIVITTVDIWHELRGIRARVARLERLVAIVSGGSAVIASIVSWAASYASSHL
jgi:hypothetical protein